MDDEKVIQITNKEELENIINIIKSYNKSQYNFTTWYWKRLFLRGMEHERVLEIFLEYDKIFLIEKRKLKFGDIGYELFYKLSNNTSFSIAIIPLKDRLEFIHAIEYKRKLDKRIKNFKQKR